MSELDKMTQSIMDHTYYLEHQHTIHFDYSAYIIVGVICLTAIIIKLIKRR